MTSPKSQKQKISVDWGITIIPLLAVLALAVFLIFFPDRATASIELLRGFVINNTGFTFSLVAIGMFILSFYLSFSKFGNIKLGKLEKPRYSNLSWMAMILTSCMAVDFIFWGTLEWAYYFVESPLGMENMTLAQRADWAAAYPLFHWGPMPWMMYTVPAAALGYMMFVKKRPKQRASEACRSVLGSRVDGVLGKAIDIFVIVALLASTSISFALGTPVLTEVISEVTGIPSSQGMSVVMLLMIGVLFTLAVLFGIKGISKLSNVAFTFYGLLLAIFLVLGPTRYIIETGITAFGHSLQNLVSMSTWLDPLRVTSADGTMGFPQTWTVFYYAWWVAWSIAAPFFIAKISEGRTIRQTIMGGCLAGTASTLVSFIIFGNFGLHIQTSGKIDLAGMLASGSATPGELFVMIYNELPMSKIMMVVAIITMVTLCASTFDAMSLTISSYSLKNPKEGEESDWKLRVFWSLVLILLPMALIFTEAPLSTLQALTILGAVPIMVILIIVIVGFVRDLKRDTLQAVPAETPAEEAAPVSEETE
ncbi:MAG: BCCT family transporter [Oscillospiraceae bacterium]|jgi:BCCT family betaine/carnitine transporter|nr:BCCT family transporter [Oscillospiraceae bacterium]